MADKKYVVTKGCTFCYTCIPLCPVEAIEMTEEGAKIDQDECIGCGVCYENCSSEAVEEKEEQKR
ncbi:MAG: DUF362 domain-containing protein [Candidatus Brocadiia bacterium]